MPRSAPALLHVQPSRDRQAGSCTCLHKHILSVMSAVACNITNSFLSSRGAAEASHSWQFSAMLHISAADEETERPVANGHGWDLDLNSY